MEEYKRHLENEVLGLSSEERIRLQKSIEEWKYLLFKPELQDYVVTENPTETSQYTKQNYWWLKKNEN